MNKNSNSTDAEFSKPYLSYVLASFFVINMFNLGDRVVFSATVEPIKAEFGLSDTHIGLLTGIAFALLYACMGLPIARWADVGRRKNILSLALLVWSAMTAFTAMAQNFFMLLIARIFVGTGEAGCIPTSQSLVADYFSPKRRGMAMGILMGGGMFGTVAGFIIGSAIAQEFGWRAAFLTMGLPGVVLAAIVWLTLKEPTRGRYDANAPAAVSLSLALKTIVKSRSLVFIMLASGVGTFAVYGLVQWGPAFLIRSFDFSVQQAGQAFGLYFGIPTMIGTVLGGVLGDALSKNTDRGRIWFCLLIYVVVGPFLYLAFSSSSVSNTLFFIAIASFLAALPIGSTLALIVGLVSANMRAVASAIGMFLTSLLGIGLAPLVVGAVSDILQPVYGLESLRMALQYSAAVPLLAALLFWFSSRFLQADITATVLSETATADTAKDALID